MTGKEDAELINAIEELDRAYGDALDPPPYFDEALGERPQASTGITKEELDRRRNAFLHQMGEGWTLGDLLRRRREAMHVDVEEMSRRASWPARRLEELEASELDLQKVEAERLGALLVALDVGGLGVLEEPLRKMAYQHLAVYESGGGQVFGRTRRGVTSFDRRRDLQKDISAVDEEATTRRADVYVREVSEKMAELWANRSW